MSEFADESRSALPEFTKKLVSLGLGAYFLTEEKLVNYVRDAKLPKDIGSSITSNAGKAKDELLSFVSREVGRAIKSFDLQEEIERALKKHKIKVTAEIEFIPLEHDDESEQGAREDAGAELGPQVEWHTTVVKGPQLDSAELEPARAADAETDSELYEEQERPVSELGDEREAPGA
jgi:hypothetical protein